MSGASEQHESADKCIRDSFDLFRQTQHAADYMKSNCGWERDLIKRFVEIVYPIGIWCLTIVSILSGMPQWLLSEDMDVPMSLLMTKLSEQVGTTAAQSMRIAVDAAHEWKGWVDEVPGAIQLTILDLNNCHRQRRTMGFFIRHTDNVKKWVRSQEFHDILDMKTLARELGIGAELSADDTITRQLAIVRVYAHFDRISRQMDEFIAFLWASTEIWRKFHFNRFLKSREASNAHEVEVCDVIRAYLLECVRVRGFARILPPYDASAVKSKWTAEKKRLASDISSLRARYIDRKFSGGLCAVSQVAMKMLSVFLSEMFLRIQQRMYPAKSHTPGTDSQSLPNSRTSNSSEKRTFVACDDEKKEESKRPPDTPFVECMQADNQIHDDEIRMTLTGQVVEWDDYHRQQAVLRFPTGGLLCNCSRIGKDAACNHPWSLKALAWPWSTANYKAIEDGCIVCTEKLCHIYQCPVSGRSYVVRDSRESRAYGDYDVVWAECCNDPKRNRYHWLHAKCLEDYINRLEPHKKRTYVVEGHEFWEFACPHHCGGYWRASAYCRSLGFNLLRRIWGKMMEPLRDGWDEYYLTDHELNPFRSHDHSKLMLSRAQKENQRPASRIHSDSDLAAFLRMERGIHREEDEEKSASYIRMSLNLQVPSPQSAPIRQIDQFPTTPSSSSSDSDDSSTPPNCRSAVASAVALPTVSAVSGTTAVSEATVAAAGAVPRVSRVPPSALSIEYPQFSSSSDDDDFPPPTEPHASSPTGSQIPTVARQRPRSSIAAAPLIPSNRQSDPPVEASVRARSSIAEAPLIAGNPSSRAANQIGQRAMARTTVSLPSFGGRPPVSASVFRPNQTVPRTISRIASATPIQGRRTSSAVLDPSINPWTMGHHGVHSVSLTSAEVPTQILHSGSMSIVRSNQFSSNHLPQGTWTQPYNPCTMQPSTPLVSNDVRQLTLSTSLATLPPMGGPPLTSNGPIAYAAFPVIYSLGDESNQSRPSQDVRRSLSRQRVNAPSSRRGGRHSRSHNRSVHDNSVFNEFVEWRKPLIQYTKQECERRRLKRKEMEQHNDSADIVEPNLQLRKDSVFGNAVHPQYAGTGNTSTDKSLAARHARDVCQDCALYSPGLPEEMGYEIASIVMWIEAAELVTSPAKMHVLFQQRTLYRESIRPAVMRLLLIRRCQRRCSRCPNPPALQFGPPRHEHLNTRPFPHNCPSDSYRTGPGRDARVVPTYIAVGAGPQSLKELREWDEREMRRILNGGYADDEEKKEDEELRLFHDVGCASYRECCMNDIDCGDDAGPFTNPTALDWTSHPTRARRRDKQALQKWCPGKKWRLETDPQKIFTHRPSSVWIGEKNEWEIEPAESRRFVITHWGQNIGRWEDVGAAVRCWRLATYFSQDKSEIVWKVLLWPDEWIPRIQPDIDISDFWRNGPFKYGRLARRGDYWWCPACGGKVYGTRLICPPSKEVGQLDEWKEPQFGCGYKLEYPLNNPWWKTVHPPRVLSFQQQLHSNSGRVALRRVGGPNSARLSQRRDTGGKRVRTAPRRAAESNNDRVQRRGDVGFHNGRFDRRQNPRDRNVRLARRRGSQSDKDDWCIVAERRDDDDGWN